MKISQRPQAHIVCACCVHVVHVVHVHCACCGQLLNRLNFGDMGSVNIGVVKKGEFI